MRQKYFSITTLVPAFLSSRMILACVRGFFTLVLLLLFSQSTDAANVNNAGLRNFNLKIEDGKLIVFVYNTSIDSTHHIDQNETPQYPAIELGVQLSKDQFQLYDAKKLSDRKIYFGDVHLELKNNEEEQKCLEITWSSTLSNVSLEDCFPMNPHHWYGGAEQSDQYWPVEEAEFNEVPYVTKSESSQAIAEPYWLNSNGFLIYVDPAVPLFIDQNHHRKGSLCIIANHTAPYLRKGGPTLKYTVCQFDNPRLAHEYAIEKWLGKPSGIPDTRIVEHPIWSTWAKYKTRINEDVVLEYAKEIKDNGFNNSQLEIDDFWETCYGSLEFNKTTFPNVKNLITKLNGMGFRTTIWVHPFINVDCDTFYKEASSKGYLVKNTKGETTTTWWNGMGGYIDFTNQAAADWYEKRLRKMLTESGIDSLKFDAGESSWSPQIPVQNAPETEQPEAILQKYVHLATKFGPMIEIRAAKRTQTLPNFVRMLDRESEWGIKKLGLKSVISATFLMNLSGYGFVLPDMVGGNAYNETVSKELFIRYLQVNAFLPAIQFSIPPWDYDAETVAISKKYTALHYQYSGKIIEVMKQAVKTGQPINTPIWWVDPTNEEAHGINSEYMLGEDILVAPVLEQGSTKRDIYLPKGTWRDEANSEKPVVSGPIWLRNYSAPLDTLPWFSRVSSSSATTLPIESLDGNFVKECLQELNEF